MTTTATKNIHETSELIEEVHFNIISQNFSRMPVSREWFSSRNMRDRHTYTGLLWVITAWIKSPVEYDSRIQTDSSDTDSRYFTNDHVNSWLWQPKKFLLNLTTTKKVNGEQKHELLTSANKDKLAQPLQEHDWRKEESQQEVMTLNKEEIWQRYQAVLTNNLMIHIPSSVQSTSQSELLHGNLSFILCNKHKTHTSTTHALTTLKRK